MRDVIVITGIGGMGMAIARRLGTGHSLVLADQSLERLKEAVDTLQAAGYDVTPKQVDVSSSSSIHELAETANNLGRIRAVIHTAGVSGAQADVRKVLEINLLGTAMMLHTFESYATQGTVGVMIASMAGHIPLPGMEELQSALAKNSVGAIWNYMRNAKITESSHAYSLSKYGNIMQVRLNASHWAQKGARLISISPGVIASPMAATEQAESNEIEQLLQESPIKRIGTPEDIAAAIEFLISPSASFITGTDLLIDGGVSFLLQPPFTGSVPIEPTLNHRPLRSSMGNPITCHHENKKREHC